MPERAFEKIPRCNYRIHKRGRKRLPAAPGRQVKDYCHILHCSRAILSREKIAFHHLHTCSVSGAARESLDLSRIARGSYQTSQVVESVFQQTLEEPGPNETSCTGYQDEIVPADYKSVLFCLHILLLFRDVWLLNRVDAHLSEELTKVIEEFN
jgi:hypothetical protein